MNVRNQAQIIRDAVKILQHGGVIVIPTETTYGFSCDPRNVQAVNKIISLKGRDAVKGFLWIASDLEQVKRAVHLQGVASLFAKKYWPGPLTMVLPRRDGKGDIGIRVSSSQFVQDLVHAFGHPLVSTSANVSGQPPLQSARAIRNEFAHRSMQPDFICDGGYVPKRKPSTIISFQGEGVRVLRQGSVRIPKSNRIA